MKKKLLVYVIVGFMIVNVQALYSVHQQRKRSQDSLIKYADVIQMVSHVQGFHSMSSYKIVDDIQRLLQQVPQDRVHFAQLCVADAHEKVSIDELSITLIGVAFVTMLIIDMLSGLCRDYE